MSETEPELGLGIIAEISPKQVKVFFGASETERVYGLKSAPLKRVLFQEGDTIKTRDGFTITVNRLNQVGDHIQYIGLGNEGEEREVHESDLDDHLSFNKPE